MTATAGPHPATATPGSVPAAARRRVATVLLTLLVLAAVGLTVLQVAGAGGGALLVRPVAPFTGFATAPGGWTTAVPGLTDGC